MSDLSRAQFCEITSISPDALASLSRRAQLPFLIDQKATGRGYTLFEAFLTIVSHEFQEGHGVNVTRAAEISGDLPEALAPKWSRVVETAFELAGGTDKVVDEIMCGRYSPAGLHQPQPIAGTDTEIDADIAASGLPAVRSIRSSASRCLAVLINRGHRMKLEIPDEFWVAPFAYRQRPSSIGLAKANMEKLLADGVHLEADE